MVDWRRTGTIAELILKEKGEKKDKKEAPSPQIEAKTEHNFEKTEHTC